MIVEPVIISNENFAQYLPEIKRLFDKTKLLNHPGIRWGASGGLPLGDYDGLFTPIDIYKNFSRKGHGGYTLFYITGESQTHENIEHCIFVRRCNYFENGVREDSICIEDIHDSWRTKYDIRNSYEIRKYQEFHMWPHVTKWARVRFKVIPKLLNETQNAQFKDLIDSLISSINVVKPKSKGHEREGDPELLLEYRTLQNVQ